MWRFKQFMPKELAGLEGRTVEIGNLKINVRNAIAEGGFSCVYLARDVVNVSKQYALKHIICNDEESLTLVKKEISVMKFLKGHPNVVALLGHAIFDMGRTKEAFLVMEFCEKSLVGVLENRGAGYFEERQILLIFRDVCNAVFAMHCLSPPIAHRDLKVENVLLGQDGAWKLCDFGSTTTNHKRFDRPEEMGIEVDNIRKHTTPAYRAPEMWDLFRKEIISEQVDIWALGCLLYRICYLKSAFDGESKLQILNGNYRIPDLPRYSSVTVDLIRDMLQASPDARPDITQVWFRVNEQLPLELQKETPDRPTSAETHVATAVDAHDEGPIHAKRIPRRAPPPPPSSVSSSSPPTKEEQQRRPSRGAPKTSGDGTPLGAFWSTLHAKDSQVSDESGPVFDDVPRGESASKHRRQSPDNRRLDSASPPTARDVRAGPQIKMGTQANSTKGYNNTEDFEIRFFSEHKGHGSEKPKISNAENVGISNNDAFNAFIADFDSSKLTTGNNRLVKEELEAEIERLEENLRQANLEKAEITSKYEKLSAICRSQRQEIQELKHALAAKTPSPNKEGLQSSSGCSPGMQREKVEGSIWELPQGMLANSSTSPESTWKAFSDEPKEQPIPTNQKPRSVRTTNGHHSKRSPVSPASDTWGFGSDSFTAIPATSSMYAPSGSKSQPLSGQKTTENKAAQPAGWAGF